MSVPVRWWADADNFGDLLSPWLISTMTGREILFANPNQPHYAAIGSILNRLTWQSKVWGSGSFGNEDTAEFQPEANDHAVRGPLSRADPEARSQVLHGLIMADAYGIPSAYVKSYSARGGEYKFFDYFSTVNKFGNAQHFDFSRPVTAGRLRGSLDFDSRPIRFDHRRLLDACPFLHRVGSEVGETAAEERPVLANA